MLRFAEEGQERRGRWTGYTCLAEIGINDPAQRTRAIGIGQALGVSRDWSTEQAAHILKTFFEDEQNFIDWSRSTNTVSKEIIMMR